MPNHIRNIITPRYDDEADDYKAREAEIDALAKELYMKGEEGETHFDFNKIIPMPADVFQGDLGQEEEKKYPGEKNWYGWCPKYWGTKWNAYDTEYKNGAWSFQTAWAHPFPIVEALSKQHPDLDFWVMWADEDRGHNLGAYVMRNGVAKYKWSPEAGSFEAKVFADAIRQ